MSYKLVATVAHSRIFSFPFVFIHHCSRSLLRLSGSWFLRDFRAPFCAMSEGADLRALNSVTEVQDIHHFWDSCVASITECKGFWSPPSVESDPGCLVTPVIALKAPARTRTGDYRLETAMQSLSLPCGCNHRGDAHMWIITQLKSRRRQSETHVHNTVQSTSKSKVIFKLLANPRFTIQNHVCAVLETVEYQISAWSFAKILYFPQVILQSLSGWFVKIRSPKNASFDEGIISP